MATATERIPVLVTKQQKTRLMKKAASARLGVSEFMRRAAEAYQPGADDEMLEGLVEQIRKSTAEASKALDDALAFVAKSESRIARMENAQARKKAA
jgi:hypothetical protein